jgi:N-acetyl-anhydromuramyl-L-alanine amidase AmpD
VQELMKLYNIPKQNVLRHADISPRRKIDIDLRFLNDSEGKPKYKSWKEWQDSL